MKYLITFTFLLISFINSNAQTFDATNFKALLDLKPGQSELFSGGNFYTASNSLNNNFLAAIYNGDFIDDDLKNSVKLNGDNFFGAEGAYNFQYRFRSDSLLKISNSTLSFSLSNNYFSDIAFNNDYFTLIFYGNSVIAEADLSGFDFSFLNYQKLSFGFSKSFETEKWKTTAALSLSLLKGQKFYSMKIADGHFNTLGLGQSVDAALDYEFQSSDTANFDFGDFNGLGTGIDFSIAFKNKKSGNLLYIELLDFGQIKWNDQSLQVSADTCFSFDGQDISNLLDYSFTSFSEMNEDSLREDFYYSKTKQKETKTALPAKLGLHYIYNVDKLNTQIFVGGQTYLFSNMPSPFIYARIKPTFNKGFSVMLQFAQGGYTNFQLGFGLEKTFYERLKLMVFSANVPGFFDTENSYAQQIRLSLSYKFGVK